MDDDTFRVRNRLRLRMNCQLMRRGTRLRITEINYAISGSSICISGEVDFW